MNYRKDMPSILIDGEEYLPKTHAAKLIGVTLPTFNRNYAPRLKGYRSQKRRNMILYKKGDVENLNRITLIEEA